MAMTRIERRLFSKSHKMKAWGTWQQKPVPDAFKERFPACKRVEAFWVNGAYSVQLYRLATDVGEVLHLIARRHDMQPIRSWADLQQIKNDLVGPERVAFEVYPPASQLKDEADLYHLWVMPEGYVLPFGLHLPNGGM